MTQLEFNEYFPGDLQHLANELAKASDISDDEALRLATQSYDSLFPKRLVNSPDQCVFNVMESETKVGTLHFGVKREKAKPYVWIWNIEIYPNARGKGYASLTMTALEKEVLKLGISTIGLNVFGHNTPAIKLYKKHHYRTSSMKMPKVLQST